jgi:hypothetical protein
MKIGVATKEFSAPKKMEISIGMPTSDVALPSTANPPHRPKEPTRLAIESLQVGESIQFDCGCAEAEECVRATMIRTARISERKFVRRKLDTEFSCRIWRIK